MTTSGVATEQATGTVRDETTRYLCAAAHLDPNFADNAIREFLTEPLRAIPPSPAIDAVTVLREAVAARARRQIRDWLLLVILVAFAVSNVVLAGAWLVVGLAIAAGGRQAPGRTAAKIGIAVAVAVAAVVALPILSRVFGSGAGSIAGGLTSLSVGPLEVVLALLALVVVGLDEFALSALLTRSFRRGTFVANPKVDGWPGERWVRTLSRETYARLLDRIAKADATGNVVAYRGFEPFVGSGTRYRPFSFAIPLEPAGDDDAPDAEGTDADATEAVPFTLTELYDHVSAELLSLRDSPSLAPSNRLGGLIERSQVIVPVEELLINLADPATKQVVPSLDRPPNSTVTDAQLTELAERPLEWLRYYRWYRLETWDRDVTVSVYLHFGASDRMLYLEWTPCLLFPIAEEYRSLDQLPLAPLAPLRDALIGWVALPGELIGRLGALVRRIKPLPDLPGVVMPARYGTLYSLRELAASTRLNNYFQRSDIDRYLKVLQRRMIRAVGTFLEDRNVSTTEFMAQATELVTNNMFIAGDVTNSAIGHRNVLSGNQAAGAGKG